MGLDLLGHKVFVGVFGDETDVLAFWAVGINEAKLMGQRTDFRLEEVPKGEEGACQLGLWNHVEKIGLVFVQIFGFFEEILVLAGAVGPFAIMAGGDKFSPEFIGLLE